MKLRWFLTLILFVAAVVSSYFAIESYAEAKLREKFDRKITSLPVNVSYSDLKYQLLENRITIKNLKVSELGYTISTEKITVDLPITARKKELPESLQLKMEGFSIPTNLPFIKNFFKIIGLNGEKLMLNLNTEYSFDGNVLLTHLATSSPALGDLVISSYFTNITKEKLQMVLNGTADEKDTLKRVALAYLNIRYRDRGLLQNFFNQEAKQEGISVEELKKRFIQTIEKNIRSNQEIREKIAYPLISFIKNPSCLEITLKPVQPISIGEVKHILKNDPHISQIIKTTGLILKTCD
jgi:hypothetical protein